MTILGCIPLGGVLFDLFSWRNRISRLLILDLSLNDLDTDDVGIFTVRACNSGRLAVLPLVTGVDRLIIYLSDIALRTLGPFGSELLRPAQILVHLPLGLIILHLLNLIMARVRLDILLQALATVQT